MKNFCLVLAVLLLFGASGAAQAECVDQSLAEILEQKRRRRDVKDRLFVKAGRHEISAFGGYYAADLLGGSYLVGGAYTYHMTEDFGIEGYFAFSQATIDSEKILERRGVDLVDKANRRILAFGDLIWSPIHAKLALGPTIVHFDAGIVIGAGIVDTASSADLAGTGGGVLKFLMGRSWAIRVDVRDHVFRQELFGLKEYVNDLTFTLGVSTFLPTRF